MKAQFAILAQRLGTSPAKLGVMLSLVAVGLLLWGRLLLKEPPRVATATPPSAAKTPAPAAPTDKRLPTVEVRLGQPARPDLFSFSHDRYKPTPKIAPVTTPAKSPRSTADESQGVQAVVAAARRLKLQSVITGSEPHAMINDQMVKVGQVIEGFTVIAVRERFVVVQRDGTTIQIGM